MNACEMCHAPVPPGEQFHADSDYILCADRVTCTERFLETAKAKAEDEPVKEDAAP